VAHFLPDSTVMIAAVSSWHEHHAASVSEIDRRLSEGEAMVIAAPALVETYAVLTRLPAQHRLAPDICLAVLQVSFGSYDVVALDASAYWPQLRAGPDRGVAGGRIYDALIFACAQSVDVDTLLTLNTRHFEQFGSATLRIVAPGSD
jgi:predicted nucleic acid-binding protein